MPRLEGGQAGTIAVAKPEVGEAWRVPVAWCYLPGRWKTFKVKATWFVRGHGGFDIQTYTNYTEESRALVTVNRQSPKSDFGARER